LLQLAAGASSRLILQIELRFEPDEFFTGTVKSWGVVENRPGEPHGRFTTESIGKKEADGEVRITQTFFHEDGSAQKRFWHVQRLDQHHYEAAANDVVGKARGVADGNAFRWTYTIAVKPGNPFSHVHLTRWRYQADNTETMFTRAVVRKFGFSLVEVTESYRRIDGAAKKEQ
jgi:hypothetical protein